MTLGQEPSKHLSMPLLLLVGFFASPLHFFSSTSTGAPEFSTDGWDFQSDRCLASVAVPFPTRSL